jgi:hypothetical protein
MSGKVDTGFPKKDMRRRKKLERRAILLNEMRSAAATDR